MGWPEALVCIAFIVMVASHEIVDAIRAWRGGRDGD